MSRYVHKRHNVSVLLYHIVCSSISPADLHIPRVAFGAGGNFKILVKGLEDGFLGHQAVLDQLAEQGVVDIHAES